MSAEAMLTKSHPLSGLFFHTYSPDEKLRWQGLVKNVMLVDGKDVALCQLFSFLDGCPTDMVMLSVADLVSYGTTTPAKFYTTQDDWVEAHRKQSR